jgi:endonuclease/exonuclease/phosphatase (EEP) superfamily protein YafD
MNQQVRMTKWGEAASARAVRRQALDRFVAAAAAAGLVATLASYLGATYWLPELLTHFRMHFATGLILVLLGALACRRFGVATVAAALAAANLVPMLPYIAPGPPQAEAGQAEIRVMSANVSLRNADYAALRAAIVQENPDIIGLQEVTGKWLDELSPIRSDYPFTVLRPEEGAYGLALFSRFPIRELGSSPYLEEGIQTAVSVEMEVGQKSVTLVLAHLKAPTTPRNAKLRNRQIDRLADMIGSDRNDEQILVGDFNTTPWSPYYLPLETEANLANAARGRGYRATWPVGLGFLKIPIDHCMVSPGLRVRQMRTGGDIGSDHFPIIVDVAFADVPTNASL